MNPKSKLSVKAAALCAVVAGIGSSVTHHGVNEWGLAGVAAGVVIGGLLLIARRRA